MKKLIQNAMRSLLLLLQAVTMILLNGCSAETYQEIGGETPTDTITIIKEILYNSDRSLNVTATPKNKLGEAELQINETAYVKYVSSKPEENFSYQDKPKAYVLVEISTKKEEYLNGESIPESKLLGQKVIDEKEKNTHNRMGKDIIKEFKFDNNVITVKYGYEYMGFVSNGKEYRLPHIKINNIRLIDEDIEKISESPKVDVFHRKFNFEVNYIADDVSVDGEEQKMVLSPYVEINSVEEKTEIIETKYEERLYQREEKNVFEITQFVKTNKGDIKQTYEYNISLDIKSPKTREITSLDSLFTSKCECEDEEKTLSETRDQNFEIKTISGSHTSFTKGENGTELSWEIGYTYQVPIRFQNEYGSHIISPINLNFEEKKCETKKITQTKWLATNVVGVKLKKDTNDNIDLNDIVEKMYLNIKKDVPSIISDEIILSGNGDEYIAEKITKWSDGKVQKSAQKTIQSHSITPEHMGNIVTNKIENWTTPNLEKNAKFSSPEIIKNSDGSSFEIERVEEKFSTFASNGSESGEFAFIARYCKVTYCDGERKKEFPLRNYKIISQEKPTIGSPQALEENGKKYKSYSYDFRAKFQWQTEKPLELVSRGNLLVPDMEDSILEPTYNSEITWSGYTAKMKVTKTTKHTMAPTETKVFTFEYHPILGKLKDGELSAIFADGGFVTKHKLLRSYVDDTYDTGNWKLIETISTHQYETTNGKISRQHKVDASGAIILFHDGDHEIEFDLSSTVEFSYKVEDESEDDESKVINHYLEIRNIVDNQIIKTQCVTKITLSK